MPTETAITDLESRIDKFYQSYSNQRVGLAALLVAVVAILGTWITYHFTQNTYIAMGVFAVSSLVAVNIAMFLIVPPTKVLAKSKALIVGALKNPQRIQSLSKKKVKLANERGTVRDLNGFELQVWKELVVPHLIRGTTGSASHEAVPFQSEESQVSSSEYKVMEKRRAELAHNEKLLLAEREKLKIDRLELETRSKLFRKTQDLLEDRAARVEASKDDLVRLKANLRQRIEDNKHLKVDDAEAKVLKEKAEELQAQERALESAKKELVDDRNRLEVEKVKLEANLGTEQATTGDAMDVKSDNLEALQSELEERLRFVADVEDDLINRLNLLAEREASVEQTEVNSGLRED